MQLEALEKIDFLIFKNDLLGLLDLIKSNDNLQVLYKNGQKFLTNCYKYQSFDIAAFLLSKNIKFDIRNLLYNNLTSKNAPKYIEHLFNIKPFIDLDDFDNLLSLFSAVMKVESHNKKELSKGCLML